MKQSGIGFCDYSGGALNFVRRGKRGDCEYGPGCDHCWALAIGKRFDNLPEKTTCYPEKLKKLAKMRFPEFSPKWGAPHKPMVFPCATGDLFHENVPDEFIAQAWEMMIVRKDMVWQVLTKRAERMRDLLNSWQGWKHYHDTSGPHMWLGVSVSNQRTADERIPILLDTPAAVRFVSVEPMLGPVNFRAFFAHSIHCPRYYRVGACDCGAPGIDWVIVGAESGSSRRPFDVAWAADLLHQCQEVDVACFLKQDSGLYPGKPLIVDGSEWKEFPR